MPAIILWPLITGIGGFGLGFFSGSDAKKLLSTAVIIGVAIYAYNKVRKG